MERLIKKMAQEENWRAWNSANSAAADKSGCVSAKSGCVSAAPKTGCVSAAPKVGCVS